MPGGADRSYGIYVARLAGVPEQVVRRAQEIEARLQVSQQGEQSLSNSILEIKAPKETQKDLFHLEQDELLEELKTIDVMAITPMDALQLLFTLREKARKL